MLMTHEISSSAGLLAILGGVLLTLPATAQTPAQPQVTLTATAPGTWNAAWLGIDKRTYFLQRSTDLQTWSYIPLMDFGFGNKFQSLSASSPKFFTRLVTVDDTGATTLPQARAADYDGDGIPNAFEIETISSDPLDKSSAGGDTNNNSLADGWEIFYFGNLTTAMASAVIQPDGLSNKEKADLGLSPNIDYSATNAATPSSFSYDLVGRLTQVSAPVAATSFTHDEEGNLNSAQ